MRGCDELESEGGVTRKHCTKYVALRVHAAVTEESTFLGKALEKHELPLVHVDKMLLPFFHSQRAWGGVVRRGVRWVGVRRGGVGGVGWRGVGWRGAVRHGVVW